MSACRSLLVQSESFQQGYVSLFFHFSVYKLFSVFHSPSLSFVPHLFLSISSLSHLSYFSFSHLHLVFPNSPFLLDNSNTI